MGSNEKGVEKTVDLSNHLYISCMAKHTRPYQLTVSFFFPRSIAKLSTQLEHPSATEEERMRSGQAILLDYNSPRLMAGYAGIDSYGNVLRNLTAGDSSDSDAWINYDDYNASWSRF